MGHGQTLGSQLRLAAAAAGSHVVDGYVDVDRSPTMPEVLLRVEEALALISATRPRLLYVEEQQFDLEARVYDVCGRIGVKDVPAAVAALASKARHHDGRIGVTTGQFVIDSVLHTTMEVADWLTQFEAQLELIADNASVTAGEQRRMDQEAQAQHIEALARKLAVAPEFNFGRTSAAKRHLLAQAMFPSEGSDLLHQVVDLADRLDWLAQSGFAAPGS